MTDPQSDIHFMRLALEEAKKGIGRTSPNPCVGAVIVKDGTIVSRGYHEKAGTPHAEVHALAAAGPAAAGATLYVTLEPCCHTGKTPPCAHAVAAAGIRRVVVGMVDPNPLVDGGGNRYLADYGIEVESGVLEDECRTLNEPFIKRILTGTPLVLLKAGVSLDGRLSYTKGKSGWITGPESAQRVHMLRDSYDAILVGSGTVNIDDPSLTTRCSDKKGRDPVRVILDTHLSTSPEAKVYSSQSPAPALVFCSEKAAQLRGNLLRKNGVEIIRCGCDGSGRIMLSEVLSLLAEKGINSVLVEGGGTVHGAFLQEKLADKDMLFFGPLFAGSGGCSLTQELQITSREGRICLDQPCYTQLGDDLLVEWRIRYP